MYEIKCRRMKRFVRANEGESVLAEVNSRAGGPIGGVGGFPKEGSDQQRDVLKLGRLR